MLLSFLFAILFACEQFGGFCQRALRLGELLAIKSARQGDLKAHNSVISDIIECLAKIHPVDGAVVRHGMRILITVIVVNVEDLEKVLSDPSYGVSDDLSDKIGVTRVKADL